MNHIPQPQSQTTEASSIRPQRRRVQVGLSTLLLLTAFIGSWLVTLWNHQELVRLEARTKAMGPLAHELIIDDPTRIAVVKQDERMYDEQIWKVFIPDDSLSLRLSTRNIPIEDNALVQNTERSIVSAPLGKGQHVIGLTSTLEDGTWITRIEVDGKLLLTAEEDKPWDPQHGSSGGGNFSTQHNFDVGTPVVLFKRRFRTEALKNPAPYQALGNGVLLWIDQ